MTDDDIRHGTYGGAQQHILRGESLEAGNSVCEPCRTARNDYVSAWRRHTTAPGESRRKQVRRAEGRAMLRLRDAHREEFERYIAEELAQIGVSA